MNFAMDLPRVVTACLVAAACMIITALVMTDAAEIIIEHTRAGWQQTIFVTAGLVVAAIIGVALYARFTHRK